MAPLVVANLIEVLGRIHRQDVTILLAGQNLKFCRRICHRGCILGKGMIRYEGRMEDYLAERRNHQKIFSGLS